MTQKRFIGITYFVMLSIVSALTRFEIAPPIPFTLQSIVAILAGIALGYRDGATSQIIYAFLGFLGLPIFTNGGGIKYFLEPSCGYILALAVGSLLAGQCFSRDKIMSTKRIFVSGLIGLVSIYFIGMVYQYFIVVSVMKLSLLEGLMGFKMIPIMFVKDVILLLVIAYVYPKAMNMQKIEKKEIVAKTSAQTEKADN